MGIDLKWSKELNKQKDIFQKFIKLSIEIDKPLIIHSRNAESEVIEILKNMQAKKVIMHCFSGNMKLVEEIVKNNWMLSIPANVVFSEHFQQVVKRVDIGNLLCETDSPYLPPVPYRGKRNESAYIVHVAEKLSDVHKVSLREIEETTTKNAFELFNLPA